MALIDALRPQRTLFLPNTEEQVTLVFVPQHQIFALNKEVKKYLQEFDLHDDFAAKQKAFEAATLIRSIRKHGSVGDLTKDERGEPLFHSIESFMMRFTDDQQEFLMAHYEILKRETIPSLTDIDDEGLERIFEQIDSGKDLSPSLKDFGYATLLSFTLSLVSRLHQSREA